MKPFSSGRFLPKGGVIGARGRLSNGGIEMVEVNKWGHLSLFLSLSVKATSVAKKTQLYILNKHVPPFFPRGRNGGSFF